MNAQRTFLNLNIVTQKRIIDIALLEFTMSDYQGTSLSTIIKKLGLAKGSFYRYFNSKKDLYLYLIDYTTKIRYNEVDELTGQLPDRLEELLILNFRNKLAYDKNYPLYSGFLYRAMLEMNNAELGNISQVIKLNILEKTRQILLLYSSQGKIRTGFELDAATFAILQLQMGIYDYLSLKYKIDFLKNIAEGKPVFSLKEDEVMKVVIDFASIITSGITKE